VEVEVREEGREKKPLPRRRRRRRVGEFESRRREARNKKKHRGLFRFPAPLFCFSSPGGTPHPDRSTVGRENPRVGKPRRERKRRKKRALASGGRLALFLSSEAL